MMMVSQYHAIGDKHKVIKELPTALVEKSNVRVAIAPRVKDARVLDLTCGTSFFSRLLIDWGAASVVGVDLSPAMVVVAEREAKALDPAVASRMRYHVGDAVTLGQVDPQGKGFYHAIGAWLLNYAGDEEELAAMFATIAANLNGPDSVFVGIATPPAARDGMDAFAVKVDDPISQKKLRELLRVAPSYYTRNDRMPEGEGGWRVELTSVDNPDVSFRN